MGMSPVFPVRVQSQLVKLGANPTGLPAAWSRRTVLPMARSSACPSPSTWISRPLTSLRSSRAPASRCATSETTGTWPSSRSRTSTSPTSKSGPSERAKLLRHRVAGCTIAKPNVPFPERSRRRRSLAETRSIPRSITSSVLQRTSTWGASSRPSQGCSTMTL